MCPPRGIPEVIQNKLINSTNRKIEGNSTTNPIPSDSVTIIPLQTTIDKKNESQSGLGATETKKKKIQIGVVSGSFDGISGKIVIGQYILLLGFDILILLYASFNYLSSSYSALQPLLRPPIFLRFSTDFRHSNANQM